MKNHKTDVPNFISTIKFITAIIFFLIFAGNIFAQDKSVVVRLAKIEIDTAQLDNYKAALKEEIETSVRLEPGVLSLYAVYDKNNPALVTIFEIYANVNAYNAHRESSHFKKYKNTTKDMVKSLELIEAVPIILGAKEK